jgi:hypothetical protein
MTKPDRPLNLDLGRAPFEAVLDLPELLTNMSNKESWQRVKTLVASCSDWTIDDLGALNVREALELSRALAAAKIDDEAQAVPPVTAGGSTAGPPASVKRPAGRQS